MSLKPSSRVQKLQETQHTRAKESPNHRFYALYEQICQRDVLETAYQQSRTNGGGAGVDGETFPEIEKYGVTKWLDELEEELGTLHYQPAAVRRIHTPKPGGKQRRLHLPTVRDRVVQMAVLLVIEPIFEADLPPEKYAYQTEKGSLAAIRHVQRLVKTGRTEMDDMELSNYFDSIPHEALMELLARRINDRHLLQLIKMWLVAPVEETDAKGRVRRSTRNKDVGRGCPLGVPISPLLVNLYVRRTTGSKA
jgi:RNA-directed DNA polymerase